jgi:hypothetical protein
VRRFEFHRDTDVTGVSGTGVVVQGVEFDDLTVVCRWISERPSTVFWSEIEHATRVHGHDGKTRLVWVD